MVDYRLPDWATRFHFEAHSPSGANRPDSLEFFEKAVARPAKLWAGPNAPMVGGKTAEQHAKRVVLEGQEPGESLRHSLSDFDQHTPLAHVPDDAVKFDIMRNGIYKSEVTEQEDTVYVLTLDHLLRGTQEATQGENKVIDGPWVSVYMPDVSLPYIGQIDIQTRGVVECKTQWPYVDKTGKAKRGWKLNSLPAKPKPDHISQVALYWSWMKKQSDNVPVHLVYANCRGFRVFSSDDCDQLSEAHLNEACERLRRIARTREALMRKADNIKELLELVAPDFGHWMWRDKPPEYKALAEQSWQ
jgi:hypothetical protein